MFFDLSAPEYENFTLCGKCGYAALAFDSSSQIIGLSCYYLTGNPAELDLHKPTDKCDKF